uniref:Sec1 family domain-containing protein 1 n=1 Tax=Aureoumbra lagunensis TaxID=44058 RepID=A0A7S3JTN2_9STRA|mmetsp:Transcript_8023/g.12234  ORF Transcript_8023/g.12234 Transcript_8023/m.12234 type:complete len:614 (+) Transcript_8023:74-1915(+)
MSKLDIRESTRQAVKVMLASASSSVGGNSDEIESTERIVWKVLVLDSNSRDSLAPLMSVNELRRLGVASHLSLEGQREPLSDAVGVYLCRPSNENAKIIAYDVAAERYGAWHINFSSRAERVVLEAMARELAGALESQASIPRLPVWDRHLEYIALEPRLFTLGIKNTLEWSFAPDQNALMIERVATGLWCACISLFSASVSSMPLIRARPGSASEKVAVLLSRKLSEAAQRKSSLSGGSGASIVTGTRRPVIILLDRLDDLATALRHTESYQSLADDVLHLERNKCTWEGAGQSYELCVDGEDEFFARHSQHSLPDVIEASSQDLTALREAEKRVRARTGGDKSNDENNTTTLADAVGELPALVEKKKRLEAHTSILGAIMSRVVSRELPRYFDAEEARRPELFELLGPQAKGTVRDKLRLLFVKGIERGTLSDEELTKCETLLRECHGPELSQSAFKALRDARSLHSVSTSKALQDDVSTTGVTFAKMLSKAHAGATKLVDKAAAGVHSLLVAKSALASRAVDDLMDLKGKTHDDFILLDPLATSWSSQQQQTHQVITQHADAICFMVGGGCYAEYHALQIALANSPRTVVYGTTELLNPEALLNTLIHSN